MEKETTHEVADEMICPNGKDGFCQKEGYKYKRCVLALAHPLNNECEMGSITCPACVPYTEVKEEKSCENCHNPDRDIPEGACIGCKPLLINWLPIPPKECEGELGNIIKEHLGNIIIDEQQGYNFILAILSWHNSEIEKLKEKYEKDRYCSPCSGCKDGHPSFWKTVIESSQWKLWEEEQSRRIHLLCTDKGKVKDLGIYDMPEVCECGWISPQHFQEFIRFIHASDKSKLVDSVLNAINEFGDNPKECLGIIVEKLEGKE